MSVINLPKSNQISQLFWNPSHIIKIKNIDISNIKAIQFYKYWTKYSKKAFLAQFKRECFCFTPKKILWY